MYVDWSPISLASMSQVFSRFCRRKEDESCFTGHVIPLNSFIALFLSV